jgi:hypothetical protein
MKMSIVEGVFIWPRFLGSVLVIGLAATLAGCGGGSGSSPALAAQGLWVANFASDTIVEFSAGARKKTGAPAATLTNSSDVPADPDDCQFRPFKQHVGVELQFHDRCRRWIDH